MDNLQTDTLTDYAQNPNHDSKTTENEKDNVNTDSLLNGCDDIDPLDLMDNCDNQSIGSNSDVWKASDSEDEEHTNTIEPESDVEKDKEEQVKQTEELLDKNVLKDKEEQEKQPPIESIPETETTKEMPKELVENSEDKTPTPPAIEDQTQDNDEKNKNENHEIIPLELDEEKKNEEVAETPTEEIKEKESETLHVNSNNPSLNGEKNVKENIIVNGDSKAGEGKEPPAPHEKDPLDLTENAEDNESMDFDDDDDDDDIDPSLLCPEVTMAVDENPVITNSGNMPSDDGSSSPLPYEPLFSTFVDDMTGAEISFNLTPEEQELRRRLYGPSNPIEKTKIHCTACNVHLGSALEGQTNRFVHPMLKVLICKECYHFYTSGEFEKDEDGSELYCRWCGQGGQVLCCSKCEFVFCKRCIRTNFGRKKMFEIRDSDSWDCFRCAPSQLMPQRVACYEFFEYVRREISRNTILNSPNMWSKDYTVCCLAKRKLPDIDKEVDAKKTKRKKLETDPDYDPLVDKPPNPVPSKAPGVIAVTPKPMQILSKILSEQDNDIEFIRHIPAPQVTFPRPTTSGYRPILPRPVMQPPSLVRFKPPQLPPLVSTNHTVANRNVDPIMKHEWFEKTVRAAARVNSHLSYTLTQLNKAQSQASSVEELAVVHNKLQEILSSSINSLIQIRKNLRAEFITGIKTVKFPPTKRNEANIERIDDDDDVILVSAPPTMTKPSTSIPIAKTTPNLDKPVGGYLKVKSVFELQNVPSECITIPDDMPPLQEIPKVQPNQNKLPEMPITNKILCNGTYSESRNTSSEEAPSSNQIDKNKTVYDVTTMPHEVKKMMNCFVKLLKVDLLKLQEQLATH